MNKDNFTLTFLDKNMRRCEEKDAYFVDIVERNKETGQIVNQVLGTVDREAIKRKYAEKENDIDRLFSKAELLKKQAEEFNLTGTKYIDIDVLINNITNEIVKNLTIEEKKKWVDNPEYDYFGRGLWIRNNYIYPKTKNQVYYGDDPDDISNKIFEKVMEILKDDINVKKQ